MRPTARGSRVAIVACLGSLAASAVACGDSGAGTDASEDGGDGRDGDGDGGCVPVTCDDLGRQCGDTDDHCGNPLHCGACGSGAMCDTTGRCVPLPPAGAPVLFFSDLESGPATGWEGTSARGAAVTVWGKSFGPTRGTSFVTVGGADLATDGDYAEWGGMGPSLGLERLVFFVPAAAASGVGTITVTVGGVASNALPFTVRSGNIRYATTAGNDDTGDGSWATPWRRRRRPTTARA
jgi:hypothetical protein